MKNLLSVFLVFIAIISVSAQYDPKALEVLDAMGEKYKSLPSYELNFTFTQTNDVEKVNEEFKGKLSVKDEKFHMVLPEQEVINNGATVWTYLPEAKEVNIDNYDPNSDDINPFKIYEIYKKNFKYLSALNNKHHFFKTIVPLSHPRFIMQYRRKQKKEFIDLYINSLKNK